MENQNICLEINTVEPQKIKRGRPKTLSEDLSMKDYMRSYYLLNIEKTKGDILCKTCNVLHSKSNKSRHNNSKYHLNNLKKNQEEIPKEII